MAKVTFESQPVLNADEEKLVEILGDDGLSDLLRATLTGSGSIDAFEYSDMDDIDFDNINYDKVVLATVLGYETADSE